MYAHQVIEDIYKIKKEFDMGIIGKTYHNVVDNAYKQIPFIESSQKFHMGDCDDVISAFKHTEGDRLFSDQKYLKLPYQNIWLDSTFKRAAAIQDNLGVPVYTDSKHAGLIYTISKNTYILNTFCFAKEINRWFPSEMFCIAFIGGPDHDKIKLVYEYYGLDAEEMKDLTNHIIKNKINAYHIPLISKKSYSQAMFDVKHEEISGLLSEIECSIKLLNCKNIETQKVPAPPALNKKRIKSGKQPIFDYHVLNLVLPSNKNRGYQEQSVPLSHNRVHLCRGHFKEYTKEHPLFGKHTGLYWWEPSVRGQNRDGIVIKDYKVKPA